MTYDFSKRWASNPRRRHVKRRTVKMINETLEPGQIFKLIMSREVDYSVAYKPSFPIRDRAGMALSFLTNGRVEEIFGGPQFKRIKIETAPTASSRKAISKYKMKIVGKHKGLQRENLTIENNLILIRNMIVVKRSPRVIEKYGPQVALRILLRCPLELNMYTNIYYNQLVPFSWLVMEYLNTSAPKSGKLFPFQDTRAWQIINEVTGKFPNWFRAQADRFYGSYITKDSVAHAQFVGRVNPISSMPYVRYDSAMDLKDVNLAMDFSWIASAIEKIKERLKL